MIETWIRRYFGAERVTEVETILSEYGTEPWHREPERVRRDAIIISRGSIDALKATIALARNDYRDVLIGERVDPWVVGELKKHGS